MGTAKFLALVARVQSFGRNNIKAQELIGQEELVQMQKMDQGTEKPAAIDTLGDNINEQMQIRRFSADLTARLQQLQLQGGGGSAHLNWLLDACAATLSTHSSLTSLLTSHAPHVPAPACSTQRADEVLSLLDLCTSLKHMADDVDRQLSLLQRTLHTAAQALQHKPLQGCSATPLHTVARRLRRCLDGLQFLETRSSKQSYKPLAEAHTALLLAAKRVVQTTSAAAATSDSAAAPLNNALDGTLLISLLLLASSLSSFTAPTTRSSVAMRSTCKLITRYASTCRSKSGSSNTVRGAADATTWVAPLQQLQRDLKQEEMSCVFLDIQRLQASASSLHGALVTSTADPRRINVRELRHSVDSMRKSSQEAQACISALRSHLASLFQALLALRLTLLPC